ncbi:MAG: alpha/beta fold hydrolase [Desulfurivibrionaceae bacterium]
MSFIYLNRSGEKTDNERIRVFLPGWGFDGWSALLFPPFRNCDLVIPDGMVTPEIMDSLNSFLKKREISKIDLIGWSMGANLGLDYALKYGEKISSLTLAAMRSSWPAPEIGEIRKSLSAAPEQFMEDFYRKCFLGARKTYEKFIAEFQGNYLNNLEVNQLIDGLDYLESYNLVDPPVSAGIKLRVLHGDRDIVAPLSDRPKLAGARELIIPYLGHAVLSADRVTL